MSITVNSWRIDSGELLDHAVLQNSPILEELIERALLRQYAASRGIVVTPEELQLTADEMRYERGLQTAEQTMEWLRARGQTVESLQASIEALLIRNKAMAAIREQEVEAFFKAHWASLESVVLFSIRLSTEADAIEALRRIHGGAQFLVVAAACSQDEVTRGSGGLVGRIRRGEMSPEIASAIFAATPGTIVGPVQTAKGFNLFLAIDRRQASYDQERAGIRLLLFRELVSRLRAEADIRFSEG